MFLLPKFFYDDNATDGAGGNAEGGTSDTPTTDQKPPVNTNVDVLKPLFSEEEIKSFGFDNADQLKEHLRQTKENRVPDDVKKRNSELEKAEFIKVSTDEGLMTVDDYTAYESLTKKSDRDLVFEKYAAEYREDNPEATDELIKTEFETDYKLDSKNDKTKTRGESRLKKEAEELRSPAVSKFNTAKSFVDRYKTAKTEEPAFLKFVDDLVQELTPDTLNIAKAKDGEDELDIPIKFTKEQREEIAKLFKTPKTFDAYLDNKDKLKETLSPKLAKKIQTIIKANNFDNAVSFAFKSAKEIGIKQGSDIGAGQPFAAVKNAPRKVVIEKSTQQILDEDDKKMRQKFAR